MSENNIFVWNDLKTSSNNHSPVSISHVIGIFPFINHHFVAGIFPWFSTFSPWFCGDFMLLQKCSHIRSQSVLGAVRGLFQRAGLGEKRAPDAAGLVGSQATGRAMARVRSLGGKVVGGVDGHTFWNGIWTNVAKILKQCYKPL